MTQSALVLGSEEFGNEPLHKIRYGVLALREICAQEKEWNILEVFHHMQARQAVNAMLREQVLIQ